MMPGSVATELANLAAERATGSLKVGGDGAFFLADGAVTYAECDSAPALDELVTASGRVTSESWRRARRGGEVPMGRAELETFALLALFDAAYFLLGSAAATEFVEGATHWLGPVCGITPATLIDETRRRRDRLDSEWPSGQADDAPVVPVRRLRRQRVILTGLEAEILLNADGHRTPAELAHSLGRTGFGCLLAVRSLAAASLICRPDPAALAALPTVPELPAAWSGVDEDVLRRLRDALEELS